MRPMSNVVGFLLFTAVLTWIGSTCGAAPSELIKVGIIGLDGHAALWTKIINGPDAKPPISEMRVAAAVPSFSPDIPFSNDPKIGRVLACDAYSNSVSILPGHPDLFYYGIHGCEILFTIMGPGCKTVSRVRSDTADMVVGVWEDGRLGTFHGILKGRVGFGATVFGQKGIATTDKFEGYEPLLVEILKFFRTGTPPISVEQTLEIYAFLESADQSKRQHGAPVSIQSVLEKARKQAGLE